MIVEYRDRKTEEVFEVYLKSSSEVTETVINEKTGNVSDKQFSAGSFKFANNDFH